MPVQGAAGGKPENVPVLAVETNVRSGKSFPGGSAAYNQIVFFLFKFQLRVAPSAFLGEK